jgi:hypothetical protein
MNPLILLIITSLTAITLCFAAWFVGGVLFVLALCKSAKLGDDAAKSFKKGGTNEETPVVTPNKRGGDAAPLSFSIDRIVRPI